MYIIHVLSLYLTSSLDTNVLNVSNRKGISSIHSNLCLIYVELLRHVDTAAITVSRDAKSTICSCYLWVVYFLGMNHLSFRDSFVIFDCVYILFFLLLYDKRFDIDSDALTC